MYDMSSALSRCSIIGAAWRINHDPEATPSGQRAAPKIHSASHQHRAVNLALRISPHHRRKPHDEDFRTASGPSHALTPGPLQNRPVAKNRRRWLLAPAASTRCCCCCCCRCHCHPLQAGLGGPAFAAVFVRYALLLSSVLCCVLLRKCFWGRLCCVVAVFACHCCHTFMSS